jgi:Acetyltransferase (GNAT) domain
MAHILATLSHNLAISEDDMALPENWQQANSAHPSVGHKLDGRTLALHSLAVVPELQHTRLGTTLLRSWIQMVKDAKVADRIVLLTYEKLVPWYSDFGFTSHGKSYNEHGGEGWIDMVGSSRRHTCLMYRSSSCTTTTTATCRSCCRPSSTHPFWGRTSCSVLDSTTGQTSASLSGSLMMPATSCLAPSFCLTTA